MLNIIEITDFNASELDVYARLNENQLINRHEPEKGLFITESPKVIARALDAGYEPIAALVDKTDYFHIKDVIVSTGELVPAGYGDGKIDELVGKMIGDKVLTLEPHLAVFDAYASIDNSEMKHKFHFTSNNEAFDCAVKAIKDILLKVGYKEVAGGFEKV